MVSGGESTRRRYYLTRDCRKAIEQIPRYGRPQTKKTVWTSSRPSVDPRNGGILRSNRNLNIVNQAGASAGATGSAIMWVISVRNRAGTFQHQRNIYRDSVRIGRTADNELQLPHDRVSRHHGRIDVTESGLVYRDLGSTNGSYILHQKVEAPIKLQIGSVIEIADYLLTIEPDPEHSGPTRITVAPDREPVTTPIDPSEHSRHWPSPVELLGTIEAGVKQSQHQIELVDQAQRHRADQEWSQLLVAVTKLRDHVRNDHRIASLDISTDQREVSIKVRDTRKNGGFAYLILHRGHPDNRGKDLDDGFWLREIGEPDRRFHSAREALDTFVRSIGQHIAFSPKV
jgi:hypothetical protein